MPPSGALRGSRFAGSARREEGTILEKAAAGESRRERRTAGDALRRNAASRTPLFEALLAEHRELHDLSRPLVAADYEHALEVWQWTLRLHPEASLALQLAALFHDVERLESDVEKRRARDGTDYDAFKLRHALRGAAIAGRILADAGAPPGVRARVEDLIARHELPGSDPEGVLLADADGLSFFATHAEGYLAWFGRERARMKAAWTLARLSPLGRALLATLELPPAVADLVEEAAAAERTGEGAPR